MTDVRPTLHEAIQASAHENDDEITGALLTGWVVVAEFTDTDGLRWLSKITSEGSTTWQTQGFLHNALYDEWASDAT